MILDRLPRDGQRPQYHYLPPRHWMNDPNGLIHWRGEYHFFYQHHPYGAYWANMHWGHAVSKDLVHWQDLPIALYPTPDSADQDGVYSGYAFNHNGTPTILYTGVRSHAQLPCLATGDDTLRTVTKYEGNPVIPAPPAGLDLLGFRDHSVWQEGEWWYQVIGSGIRGVGGATFLYRSRNIVDWEYVGLHCVGSSLETGTMWECPDFFPLGDKYVLVLSPIPLQKAIYFVGSYENHVFTPEKQWSVDNGNSVYAPLSFVDENGRRILFSWLREGRSGEAQIKAGWSGVASLPRLLTLGEDGFVHQEPVPELQTLRGKQKMWEDVELAVGGENLLASTSSSTFELLAEFDAHVNCIIQIKVRCSPDGDEETIISYNGDYGELSVRCAESSLDPAQHRELQRGMLPLAADEPLRLHVFVDNSVIEIFANGRTVLTTRVYPTRADSMGAWLGVVSQWGNGRCHLKRLDVWELAGIW
ncbi:MAG: glycoside hydrolase family 32 protein [Chloroflexota bacterium]